ncbi:hypothetical protein B7494_g4293 [Chlorociboria aeruginascens]|nr:hypothetical protein B7494_g4293 [Chlorociboria aeruginascens]
MAPTRFKKRRSTESTCSVDVQSFPAPPQLIPTKQTPMKTPSNRSPIRKAEVGITASQKQALLDNLQLEVTERARKLRAQYMLQTQGLRSRIQIRVNRIPMALRRANMGELLLKYSDNTATASPSSRVSPAKTNSSAKALTETTQAFSRQSPAPERGTKRLSDEISSTDKENEDIENPKKRVKGVPVPPERTTSRAKLQTQVLSPRSANSRTLPRSPIRAPGSPGKSLLVRPMSPLKPMPPITAGGPVGILTNMVEKAKSSRAAAARKVTNISESSTSTVGAGRGKRTAANAILPKTSRGRAISDSSNASTKTTVVRKPVAKKEPAKEAAKRTVMSTIKGMSATASKKTLPAKKAIAPVTGGRVLRKRN